LIKDDNKITSRQLIAMVIATLLGIGILSLSRDVTDKAGPDGWVLIILGGIIALLAVFIMIKLAALFPGQTVIEYSKTLLSAPAGILVSLGFAIYFIIFCAFEARVFTEVLKQFLLDRTPTEVIIFTMLLTSAYLVRHGLEVIARIGVILVFLIVVPIILLSLPVWRFADFTNFLPLMKTPPLKIAMGTLAVTTSYLGYEIILLIYPFLSKPGDAVRSMYIGIITVALTYLYMVVIGTAVFGIHELEHLIWPAIMTYRIADIPGAFFEKLEGLIMALWVVSVFFTLSVFYFGAVFTLSRIFRLEEYNFLVFPLVPVIYFLSLVPENIVQVYEYLTAFSTYFGIPYGLIIPVLLYIVARMRGFGGRRGEKDDRNVKKSS